MKFNEKRTKTAGTTGRSKIAMRTRTTNKAGSLAFKTSPKLELLLRAMTTSVGIDKCYESEYAVIDSLVNTVDKVASTDYEYGLKAMWFIRNVIGMRTPTTILAGELGTSKYRGVDNARIYLRDSINRVDDMTELVSYVMRKNTKTGKPRAWLPPMIKYGISKAFTKFDAYQYAKYTKDGMAVSPRDVMFLTHPIPRHDQGSMFDQIRNKRLPIPETWENYIMINGSTKENWTHILDAMGYLGIIRNLRNLLKHGVNVDDIVTEITDRERVAKSKMLPAQFYIAYRMIEPIKTKDSEKVCNALSIAMDMSLDNFPVIEGSTAIFCDNSGSMDSQINKKSMVRFKDIANVFGAMAASRCTKPYVFAYGSNVIDAKVSPRGTILANVDKICDVGMRCGGATYPSKCIEMIEDKIGTVDRIVFITDEQGYGRVSCYNRLCTYRKLYECNPFVYTFDVAHYGTTQFPENEPRHCTVGGWSEKTLNFIHLFERDGASLVDYIEKIDVKNGRVTPPYKLNGVW